MVLKVVFYSLLILGGILYIVNTIRKSLAERKENKKECNLKNDNNER